MTILYIYDYEDSRNEIVMIKINMIEGKFSITSDIFILWKSWSSEIKDNNLVRTNGNNQKHVNIRRERIVSTSAGVQTDAYESIVLTVQRYEQFRTMIERWGHWDENRRSEAMQQFEEMGLGRFLRRMGGIFARKG